ncbi:MAG TPA: DUF4126 domain-containing protein [Solirubrobacteraceae bacterium]|nr:DUF4126 domain-containing protein [Solirubrobacteraceae bacterium]
MDIVGYFTALGLATAAGLNAWIPLLATGLLARWTDVIELDGTWASLEDTAVLFALGAVAALDFVGDKVPGIDHALHAAGTVIAPATGVVAALASSSALDVSPAVMTVIGLVAAETSHGTRMAIRPFSTATTGGAGNPVVSLIEDVVSFGLSFVAILLPVLAALVVVAMFAAAWTVIRRLRRRLRERSAPAPA